MMWCQCKQARMVEMAEALGVLLADCSRRRRFVCSNAASKGRWMRLCKAA